MIRKIIDRVSGREARRLWAILQSMEFESNHTGLNQKVDNLRIRNISELFVEREAEGFDTGREPYIRVEVKRAFELLVEPANSTTLNILTFENELNQAFNVHGSDKANRHSYSRLFSNLIYDQKTPKILEIGLGTKNNFPYGGPDQTPGGSLRAWRAVFPNATLIGADIDSSIFPEIDETCIQVDQTSVDSLRKLVGALTVHEGFDLIIDDGLHEPDANLRTLLGLKGILKPGGSYVIENFHFSLAPFWQIVSKILGAGTLIDLSSERPNVDDNIVFVYKHD